jgi:uncharacterized protein (UPF0332 family)
LSKELADAYDNLMEIRHSADYEATVTWTVEDANKALAKTERVIAALRSLLPFEG